MSTSFKSKVALLKCSDYEPEVLIDKIYEGLELLGGIEQFFREGEKILLKPNLLAPDPPETATLTHHAVFEAAARVLLDQGVEVLYGDSPGFHSPMTVLKKSGIQNVAEKLNLTLADFIHKEKVFYQEGRQNRVFEIARGVLESDGIISLPKLKTHGFTIMTGAIKNQFGCIPGLTKSGFHAKLEDIEKFSQMLVDLTGFVKPRLYIMDGIWAMEGNGPRRGNRVNLGLILISSDPVALDTVASKVMGLDPRRVLPIVKGHESGLGTMENIDIAGEKIADVQNKFDLPRYSGNFKSIPPFLRNALKKLLIQQPVINYKLCTKCHECYKICPTTPRSIRIRNDKYPEHDYRLCIRCYCCQETCPEGAIAIKTRLFG